jgi:hypothetical protein
MQFFDSAISNTRGRFEITDLPDGQISLLTRTLGWMQG